MKKGVARLKIFGLLMLKLIWILSIVGTFLFLFSVIICGAGGTVGFIDTEFAISGLIVCVVLMPITHIGFKKSYIKVFVDGVLKAELPGCQYQMGGGFDKNTIDSMFVLVEPGNMYTSEDMLSGEYKGVRFQMADATVKNSVREHLYGDKYVNKLYKHFEGRMIILDSPVNSPKPVYVYSYEFEHRAAGRYNKYMSADINDKVFGDIFDVLVQQGGSGKTVLNEKIMTALKQLYQKYNNIGIRFDNNRIFLAINTKENLFDWPVKRGMTFRREIEAVNRQVNVIKDFIDLIYGYSNNEAGNGEETVETSEITEGNDAKTDNQGNELSDSLLWR